MEFIALGIGLGVLAVILYLIFYFKTNVVVPLDQCHVISKGGNIIIYNGKGRYRFIKFFHSRKIIPKVVLDIEPGLFYLHDIDNLPFGVEISIKVKVTDYKIAAAILQNINLESVRKIVEDTALSATRSVTMSNSIYEIMKDREKIEKNVYKMVEEALAKLGISAIIFDIKDIRDIEGGNVISSLERVKSAELERNARISEAEHLSKAKEVELERKSELTKKEMILKQEEMKVKELENIRQAEIDKKRKLLEAETKAEEVRKAAEAQAEAVKREAEAKAEAIKKQGLAEVEILERKSDALKAGTVTAQLQLLEKLCDAQVQSAEKIASALGKNNKIMYLPSNGNGSDNLISSLVPKLGGLVQSGVISEFLKELTGKSMAKLVHKDK